MSMLALLYRLGDRLGIIEAAPVSNASKPARIKTRSVTLRSLTTEVHEAELRDLADLPSELSVGFDRVYETAGVADPPHGWTVDRLIEYLRHQPGTPEDDAAVQADVLALLRAENVPAEDIVRDAVARDQALDAFEAFVRAKVKSRAAAREKRVAELQGQVEALKSQVDRLRSEDARETEGWQQWQKKKKGQEKEMVRAIGYLIDRPILTIEDEETR